MIRFKISFVVVLVVSLIANLAIPLYAQESDNFKIVDYNFGAGGTEGSSSDNYSIFGILGQTGDDTVASDNFAVGSGLAFTIKAAVPPAPTLENPGSTYDRLKITLNNGGNPPDAEFAIAISDDNFVTTDYVQDDGTVGPTLGAEDWQTYADWGGATGSFITGLAPSTTYDVKVKARHGNYTESEYGPEASAATQEPTLAFGVSADSVTFDNLNAGNSYTDSTKSTTVTTSTNAYNGYVVYGRSTGTLTFNAFTIPDYISPNSAPTTWTGTGFGYTTNDSNLIGGTPDRFTNGGPKYAGFTTSAPGDPVADHLGPITTPIVDEDFIISYRVTADETTAAGDYATTILYIVVPSY